MTKKAIPKDMEDMTDMFYNPERIEGRKRYESYIQANILSKLQEDVVKKIFGKMGKCEKIPTVDHQETFDFKIADAKLLIEVTSINTEPGENVVNPDAYHILEKIKKAISHIVSKDASQFPDYFKGGVIYCSTIINHFTSLWQLLYVKDFVKEIGITSSGLDFVLFIPESASINRIDSDMVYPPIMFVINESLNKIFLDALPSHYQIMKV